MFTIRLDAGHGAGQAYNRGGLCYNEGDNNYAYSLVLKKELEKIDGVQVLLTRYASTDNPSLSARSAMGKNCDLFLSLHSDAAGSNVRGTTIYDSTQKPNKELADMLVAGIAETFRHNNRGTRYRKNSNGGNYYGVLRNNPAKSAMIIEHGFHTNIADCRYFKSNHQKIAEITAGIIAKHYKLKKGDSEVYRVQVGAFKDKKNAEKLVRELKNDGYSGAYIVYNDICSKDGEKNKRGVKVGDMVKVKVGAQSYEGKSVASFVYKKAYVVDQIKGDRVLLDKNGICTAFREKDLIY